ncbi:MAG: pyridoxal-phosphate dependent enzyme, partial [Candidatus Acidiferrales bacterium]
CKLGIRPVLLLFKRNGLPRELDGNFLLDLICDAEIHTLELDSSRKMMTLESVSGLIDALSQKELRAGRKPYIAPIGASLTGGSMQRPFGAIAYVNAFLELLEQAESNDVQIDAIVFATGSGSTHAGLLAGAKLLSPRTKVAGISVSDSRTDVMHFTEPIVAETLDELCGTGNGKVARSGDDLIVFDQYLQEGYGIPDRAAIETIRLVAKEEGILLDPVYTGRAFAGMLDLIKQGYFRKGENIVFLHTGGTPAIFPYRETFRKYLSLEEPVAEQWPAV